MKLAINHPAVWTTVILFQIVPAIWYVKGLFGANWMRLNHLAEDDFARASPIKYGVSLLYAVAACYFMAWLYRELGIQSAISGLWPALCLGLFFAAGPMITVDQFSLHPFGLSAINGGLQLVLYAPARRCCRGSVRDRRRSDGPGKAIRN
ncbi:MAG: DUF1761 domain-containing protein [Acidobacteriota bacterium]|nr:DUF1761 domain-containing protein [Acidobacteriota bacterium]